MQSKRKTAEAFDCNEKNYWFYLNCFEGLENATIYGRSEIRVKNGFYNSQIKKEVTC